MSESRIEYYEASGEPKTFGFVERTRASIKDVGTLVYIHEVHISPDKLTAADLFQTLNSFTNVRDPRVPAVIDAWQEKDSIGFVTLELEGHPLDSNEARTLLKANRLNYFEEAAFQSLATLSSLHSQNATHRHVRKEVFAIHETGFIFMRDAGLIERINSIIQEQLDGNFAQLLLVSNLASYDVVDWAAMVATLMTGVPILDPSSRLSNDEILPEQVARAQKQIIQLLGENPMSSFLSKCLQARADNVAIYDNAGDAMKAYPQKDKS